jgi:glycosyltransferase involved in cell wall biosynthesis
MGNPKISIIVPIYNTFVFLERCLMSIKIQNFKDFEVLLINDGSTDSSEAFCKDFIKNDKRFILKNKINGGLSSARNYGLKYALGDYIGFVDSDDYIDENYCKILYNTASSKNLDILNFGFTYFKEGSKKARFSLLPKNRFISKQELVELLKFTSRNKMLWFTWSNFYRRDFIIKNNIKFNESILLGEDSLFNLECFYNSDAIISITESLYYYVYNESSLTQIKYKTDLLQKVETQLNARVKFHFEHQLINKKKFLEDIAKNYVEHSLIMLLNNIRNSLSKNIKEEIIKIRNSNIFSFSFKYYIPSEEVTLMMKMLIYSFKYRQYWLLVLANKIK